jgi:hypothetical protein
MLTSLFRALVLSACALLPAQEMDLAVMPRPLPPTAPSSTFPPASQWIFLYFRGNPNGTQELKNITAVTANGTTTTNWEVPAGKNLVLTDLMVHYALPSPVVISGDLEIMSKNKADGSFGWSIPALSLNDGTVAAGHHHVTFASPLVFTSGRSISIFNGVFAPYNDLPFGVRIMGWGYLTSN